MASRPEWVAHRKRKERLWNAATGDLWRYNPELEASGQNPFSLDSKEA